MAHRFAEIAFTPRVRALQEKNGSAAAYAAHLESPDQINAHLRDAEAAFIAERDSFYMASVGETGWPYVQHRGGPPGFLKVLDAQTIGFADFRGNRQYVSLGNTSGDSRVCLFLMDYPNRSRLKLFGHASITNDPDAIAKLAMPDYRGRVERGWLIRVEGFDWNRPQHITPRFTEAEVAAAVAPLHAQIRALQEENVALMAKVDSSGTA
jgi:predicted pyridoxine 5'-phosphate oxidase superfamily flavin-nucleotide-binding protein